MFIWRLSSRGAGILTRAGKCCQHSMMCSPRANTSKLKEVIKVIARRGRCIRPGLIGSGFAIVGMKDNPDSLSGYSVYSDVPMILYRLICKVFQHIQFVLRLLFKVFHIILVFVPTSLAILLSRGPFPLLSTDTTYSLIRKSLTSLGPCWIKWGQWAATRSDIFSPDFCSNLGRLHNHVYQHPWSATEAVLTSQLPGWSDTLKMDKFPLNSGTVAQVYRGVLRREGHEEVVVAVKVLHPDIRREMEMDLTLLKMGAWLFECLPGMKWLAPCRAVTNFASTMIAQLDMTIEFGNLLKFRENFKDEPNVIFPTPYQATRDILVESFEESVPISYIVETGSYDVRRKVAKTGIDLLLKMVFVDNLIHGDLHPGNLLVSRANSNKVVVLDVGMTISLSPHQQDMLYPLFKSFALGNYTEVCTLLLRDAPTNNCPNKDLFIQEMADLVEDVAGTSVKLRKLDVSVLIGRFLSLLRKHQVQLETNFTSTIVSVLVLEGLGRALDPDLDILKAALPYLLSH